MPSSPDCNAPKTSCWRSATDRSETLEKYTPELLLGLMVVLKNVVLIVACAWTTTTLYKMSGSWHALWALSMLLFMGSYRFVRD